MSALFCIFCFFFVNGKAASIRELWRKACFSRVPNFRSCLEQLLRSCVSHGRLLQTKKSIEFASCAFWRFLTCGSAYVFIHLSAWWYPFYARNSSWFGCRRRKWPGARYGMLFSTFYTHLCSAVTPTYIGKWKVGYRFVRKRIVKYVGEEQEIKSVNTQSLCSSLWLYAQLVSLSFKWQSSLSHQLCSLGADETPLYRFRNMSLLKACGKVFDLRFRPLPFQLVIPL